MTEIYLIIRSIEQRIKGNFVGDSSFITNEMTTVISYKNSGYDVYVMNGLSKVTEIGTTVILEGDPNEQR